jgi:hypothetical protein
MSDRFRRSKHPYDAREIRGSTARQPRRATIAVVRKAQIARALGAGVIAGALYAAWRAYKARVPASTSDNSWEAAPFPFPPIPRPAPAPPSRPTVVPDFLERSVESVDGDCPDSHPVKGKLTSGIYHQPGGLNYERTHADRCYIDADAAEHDGLRASKR